MRNTLRTTTLQETARRLADMALEPSNPEGISCFFANVNYDSPAICKKAAITLRNNFNAMKARERRAMKKLNSNSDLMESTLYDELGAFLEETATGWQIRIAKGDSILSQMEVRSVSSGELPLQLDPNYLRWHKCRETVISTRKGQSCSLSFNELVFFFSYDPKEAERVWEVMGWALPNFSEVEEDDELPPEPAPQRENPFLPASRLNPTQNES